MIITPRRQRSRIKAPSDAPAATKFVPIGSLSRSTFEDAQVGMSVMWKETANATIITNSPGNSLRLNLHSPTRFAVKFATNELTDTNIDGDRHRPRMGWMAVRTYTDPTAPGDWTYIRPTYSPGGGLFVHDFDGDCMVEIRPVGQCDAEGASPALESMRTSEEGAAADRGMWWEIAGFYVNEECEFDLVSIEQQPIKVLTFSDSNGAGNTDPETGSDSYELESPRYALIGQGTGVSSWDPRGTNVQWFTALLESYASARGVALDVGTNNHGGAYQTVCGPNTRANIQGFWPGFYKDGIDRIFTPFQDGDSITGGAYHLPGWSPDLVMLSSFANDLLRAIYEYAGSFGAAGESYFRGATVQANAKALCDYVLTTFTNAKMFVVQSWQTDAGAGGIVDTMTRIKNAFTAGGGTGRTFQNNNTAGAEGTTGLFISLADYAAQLGLSTTLNLGALHLGATKHAAVAAAIGPTFNTWFDTATGTVYLDTVNGNDGNAGTFAAPKKTFAGTGTSWTRLGVFRGSNMGSISLGASGTVGLPKTIFAVGSGAAPIATAIATNSKSNVRIRGIDVQGMVTITTGTGITLSHCKVHGSGTHGFSISGGTVLIEFSDIYGNTSNGIEISGGTVTTKRCTIHGNDNGVRVATGATFTDDRSHVYENAKRGIWTNGGTTTVKNAKLAMVAAPPANNIGDLTTFHGASYCDGGTANLYNVFFYNAAVNGNLGYSIRSLGAGITNYRNCVFDRVLVLTNPYILVDAVGGSGNIGTATNNVFLNAASDALLCAYGASYAAILSNLKTIPAWKALTSRTGSMDSSSTNTSIESETSATSSFVADLSAMPSAAIVAGVDLSATFTTDYFNRTRTSWVTGPWGIQ